MHKTPNGKRPKKSSKSRPKAAATKRSRRTTKAKTGPRAGGQGSTTRVLRGPPTQSQRGFLPFADRYKVRLPWAHITGLTSGTGFTWGSVSYDLNAPYRPDVAAGASSTQPRCWDQISALYGTQRTYGAKVTLRWTNPTADGLHVGYRVRTTAQPGTNGMDWDTFSTLPYISYRPLNNTGSQIMTQTVYISPNVLYGHTRAQLWTDENYQSAISTNPQNRIWIEPCVFSIAGTAISVTLTISITYYTVLTGLLAPEHS